MAGIKHVYVSPITDGGDPNLVGPDEWNASHDVTAADIPIVDTATDFTATEVEGALAELQADNEAHVAAADPHTGYQKESEKGAASGYASLDAGGLVPEAQLPAPPATDAHDASAISILDTATDFTATDVEGALAELQSDNEAHVAAADPHTGYALESLQKPQVITFGKEGVLAVGAGTMRFYTNRTYTVLSARASVGTAPTGASLIVDVNKNGTTIFATQSNRPTIAASGFTDLADSVESASLAQGDYLTVDIDQIGSTVAGSDLTIQIELLEA